MVDFVVQRRLDSESVSDVSMMCIESDDNIKPCPHCRTKVRLSQKTATVAEFGDSRRFLRQSHFSATVWTGLYSLADIQTQQSSTPLRHEDSMKLLDDTVNSTDSQWFNQSIICRTSFTDRSGALTKLATVFCLEQFCLGFQSTFEQTSVRDIAQVVSSRLTRQTVFTDGARSFRRRLADDAFISHQAPAGTGATERAPGPTKWKPHFLNYWT